MNPRPFIFRADARTGEAGASAQHSFRVPRSLNPEPADWMAGGSCDPEAAAAYGFNEAQLVSAATAAYMETFMDAPPGVDRATLRAVMVGHFVDALERLG